MGIKLLTSLFKKYNVNNGITEITLEKLGGKKIVVDIFIYLYKYLKEERLLENIYLMCFIFRKYNITPLFVFDGYDIDINKKKELIKRKQHKLEAREKYERLLENYKETDNEDIKQEMKKLKSEFVTITKENIKNVKNLIKACGMKYIVAKGEADILCYSFVKSKKAYACLTEDSDLFVYGCQRVIKHISLLNHTCLLYDLNQIMKNLNITMDELLDISILSGTDYNKEITGNIFCNKKYLSKYKQTERKITFLEWLFNEKKINMNDIEIINNIRKNYNINCEEVLNLCPYIVLKNNNYEFNEIKCILKNVGFIFN